MPGLDGDEAGLGATPDVGNAGAPHRLQNCAPSVFCAPHLLQKKVPLMPGTIKTDLPLVKAVGVGRLFRSGGDSWWATALVEDQAVNRTGRQKLKSWSAELGC